MALTQLDGDLTPQSPNPFHVPLGAASPLWLMFAGAASAGVAYWWMTRCTAATHLEAAFGAELPLEAPAPEPEPRAIAFDEAVVTVEPSPMAEIPPESALDPSKPKIKPRTAPDAPPSA